MTSSRRDDALPRLKPHDEVDELFGRANPNPDRIGCPPREVLNRSPDAIRRIGIATTARSVRKDRGVFEMASPISRCEFIALSHLLRRVGA